jgi:plasmid maintenance system antidote protein VapI
MSQWSTTTESAEIWKMARKRTLQPVNPIHPGQMLLEEFLRPAGKTQTALDLAVALGTSRRLWMNLQATFDLEAATRKRRAA